MTVDSVSRSSSKAPYVVLLIVTLMSLWVVRVAMESFLVSSRHGEEWGRLADTYAGSVLGSAGLFASVLASTTAVITLWLASSRVNRVAPGVIAVAFGLALLVPGTHLEGLLSSSASEAPRGFAISLTIGAILGVWAWLSMQEIPGRGQLTGVLSVLVLVGVLCFAALQLDQSPGVFVLWLPAACVLVSVLVAGFSAGRVLSGPVVTDPYPGL